jgi:argininosuccinate synthase
VQAALKEQVASVYGSLVHEGLYFDPACRDAEALLEASQARVTGDVRVRLFKGHVEIPGCRSPYSLMDTQVATYGEESHAWTGEEARAFARLQAMQSVLARRAWERGKVLDERRPLRRPRPRGA